MSHNLELNSPAKSTDSLETVNLSCFEGDTSPSSFSSGISKRRKLNSPTLDLNTSDLLEISFESDLSEETLIDATHNDEQNGNGNHDLSLDLGCFPLPHSEDEISDQELEVIEQLGSQRPSQHEETKITLSVQGRALLNDENTPEQALQSKRYIDFSKMSFKEVHVFQCCEKECLAQIEISDIIIARSRFSQMSLFGQKQWILDYVSTHSKSSRCDDVMFIARGYCICKLAWFAIYGIGQKRFSGVIDDKKRGIVNYENKNQRLSQKSYYKTNIAKAWMDIYFHRIGDKMPDSLVIHLPSYLNRKILYGYMCTDLKTQQEPSVVSYSQFCSIMSTEFPDVLIPKVNRLTKCDVCTVLKEEKEKTLDAPLRSYYDLLLEFHNNLQMEERKKYYKHRGKAKDAHSRSQYMCLIIDGMDQNKLLIPSLLRTAKSYASAWRLKTHLTGVLNHGRESLALVDLQQWPHDANFTMNVLVRTLSRMDFIPDTLYLQMDNCWRENKNQFVLTFLGALVKWNIFKKVKLNFLMVGHTHEDVDQMFSRIRVQLFKQNVRVVDELLEGVQKSFSPNPHAELMTELFDIRKWIEPLRTELHNISNPHVFLIKKSPDGDVILQYKQWSRDPEWLPADGLPIIKSNTELPQGFPRYSNPSSEKIDLSRLGNDIPRFFESRTFEEKHKVWWNAFLKDEFGYYTNQEEEASEWPLQGILSLKQQQHHHHTSGDDTVPEHGILGIPRPENVPVEVEQLVAAQVEEIPQVYTGRYINPTAVNQLVHHVQNPLDALKEGVLVALHLIGQKKFPVIARVIGISNEDIRVTYLKGSWKTPWQTWILRNGHAWSDNLPKSCVILVDFHLDQNNKLSGQTYKYLKQRYKDLEA